MHLWEILMSLGVFCLALWYLYRKFVATGGCSCGGSCSEAGKAGCQTEIKSMEESR